MKRFSILLIVAGLGLFFTNCDKPEFLKKEAVIRFENNSSSGNITAIYIKLCFESDSLNSNKINNSIKPGEYKTFKFEVDGLDCYSFIVNTDLQYWQEYTFNYYYLDYDMVYIFSLEDDGWHYDSYSTD